MEEILIQFIDFTSEFSDIIPIGAILDLFAFFSTIIFAVIALYIGNKKGLSPILSFFLGFFMGIVGIIVVAAIKPSSKDTNNNQSYSTPTTSQAAITKTTKVDDDEGAIKMSKSFFHKDVYITLFVFAIVAMGIFLTLYIFEVI